MGTYLIVNRLEVAISRYLQVAGFEEQSARTHNSPLAGVVRIVEAVWQRRGEAPHCVRLGMADYTRILDRVYLPLPPDPIVATALFDALAPDYDRFVDTCRNYANIERLLRVVLQSQTPADQVVRILDFGCGTGLSALVLAHYALGESTARGNVCIVGTDTSAAMLTLAKSRGLAVISYDDWRRQPKRSYTGIIASYVLHCGLTDDEWSVLAQQMTCDAVFVANYHHADRPCLNRVVMQASRVGLTVDVMDGESPQWSKDPIIVFRHA